MAFGARLPHWGAPSQSSSVSACRPWSIWTFAGLAGKSSISDCVSAAGANLNRFSGCLAIVFSRLGVLVRPEPGLKMLGVAFGQLIVTFGERASAFGAPHGAQSRGAVELTVFYGWSRAEGDGEVPGCCQTEYGYLKTPFSRQYRSAPG